MAQKPKFIVFCDTKNQVIDEHYAQELIKSFRKITQWKVEKGTTIWKDLRNFSKGYSKLKRDTNEVAHIFIIASNCLADDF